MNNSLFYPVTFHQAVLFTGITGKDQADILAMGRRCVFNSGETLFHQGDRAIFCYLVLKNRLKLSLLHEEGKEALLRYINPGEITAAVAVFREKNYPVTAVTVGPVETVLWDRNTMLQAMHVYPALSINFLQVVIDRLDDIQSRYLELQTERVEQRVARALLRIMKQSGRRVDEGILIDFRLSRKDLSDYTGTTLYTVSRTLSSWEKRGWVRSGRERIIVVDPHALVSFAETG